MKKFNNIAIFHTKCSGSSGGLERYLLDLVKSFKDQCGHIDIYALKKEKSLVLPQCVKVQAYPYRYFPRRWRKYAYLRYINKHIDMLKYDLTLSLTQSSVQDIFICGGTQHQLERHGIRHVLHNRIARFYEKNAVMMSKRIIAHSQLVADDLMKTYPDLCEEKIKVLLPPLDTKKFHRKPSDITAAIKKRYLIEDSKTNILFASCGHAIKGLSNVLDAMKYIHHDIQLYIVGAKPRYALPQNVKYLGYCNEIENIYGAMDYTILPSNYDAFGMVVAESLQCGTPVITCVNVGAHPLVTSDCGIVMPDNLPKTIHETLLSLKKDQFSVPLDICHIHRLDIQHHIAQLVAIAAEIR